MKPTLDFQALTSLEDQQALSTKERQAQLFEVSIQGTIHVFAGETIRQITDTLSDEGLVPDQGREIGILNFMDLTEAEKAKAQNALEDAEALEEATFAFVRVMTQRLAA